MSEFFAAEYVKLWPPALNLCMLDDFKTYVRKMETEQKNLVFKVFLCFLDFIFIYLFFTSSCLSQVSNQKQKLFTSCDWFNKRTRKRKQNELHSNHAGV